MPPKPADKGKAPTDTSSAKPSPTPQENPLFLSSALDDLSSSSDEFEEVPRTEIATPEVGPKLKSKVDTHAPISVSDDESRGGSRGGVVSDDHHDDDGNGSEGSNDDNEDDDDDDPVVSTYDIHITTSAAPDLYIFQYPVRSKTKPYTKGENACPLEARFKPRSGLVEVDVPVNVHVNYDEEKGRAWGDVLRKAEREKGKILGGGAGGAGGGGAGGASAGQGNKRRKVAARGEEEESEEEEEDVMMMEFEDALKAGRVLNRQTLGSKIQPDNTKYMVGIFKNDQLHLTPITSTLQLRPQFHHVDTALDAERALAKSLRDASAPSRPQEARAVHLSVKNADDPSSQLSSTMKALRVAEEEEWIKMHWVDQDTDDAWEVYEGACLRDGEGGVLRSVTGKKEYMEWLATGKPRIARVEV